MARLPGGMVGFELQSSAALVEVLASAGTVNIDTAKFAGNGNYGVASAQMLSSFDADYVVKQIAQDPIYDPVYFKFNIAITSVPSLFFGSLFTDEIPIIVLGDNAFNVSIYVTLDTNGLINIYDSSISLMISGIVPPIDGSFFRLEILNYYNGGSVEVLLNGVIQGSVSGVGISPVNIVAFGLSPDEYFGGDSNSLNGNINFDDFEVDDADYPGQSYIFHLRPNAAGNFNQFTIQVGGTAGSANNYTRVDELTPNDATDYNASAVLNQIDEFNVESCPAGMGTNDIVNCVGVGVRFTTLVAASNATFELRLTDGTGATNFSTQITPDTTAWETNEDGESMAYQLLDPDKPSGGSWTKSSLVSAQIGYDISIGATNAALISTVWALVSATPQAGNNSSMFLVF